MRFELTTPTLARLCSTPELRPLEPGEKRGHHPRPEAGSYAKRWALQQEFAANIERCRLPSGSEPQVPARSLSGRGALTLDDRPLKPTFFKFGFQEIRAGPISAQSAHLGIGVKLANLVRARDMSGHRRLLGAAPTSQSLRWLGIAHRQLLQTASIAFSMDEKFCEFGSIEADSRGIGVERPFRLSLKPHRYLFDSHFLPPSNSLKTQYNQLDIWHYTRYWYSS